MITKKEIEQLIEDTKNGNVEWFKTENTPCFDCETENFGVIICRYHNEQKPTISLTFTDDWGNEFAESEFQKLNGNQDFFDQLNEFYNIVEESATIEYL